MTDTIDTTGREIRAFVNERGVSVPSGSVALDAVRALRAELAAEIEAGTAQLTDSRGLPVAAQEPLVNGAIYRVVPVRQRVGVDDAGVPT